MQILKDICGHADLNALTDAQRTQLCAEIREFLISRISKTGGHLASNLGVVELSVAIETVFNTQSDRLVFDVGHQSYVHKLLTGRQQDFDHLRQFGGIAGFPKPGESDTDAFVAGHASSAVSIGLGMARARTLLNRDYHVVCLVGDGAATGGMTYEGLNDAADSGEPMVVILNDNEMSIDRNVGGFARHLSRLRTKERYLGMKERYRNLLAKIPGGRGIYRFTRSIKDWIRSLVLPGTIFENMGMTYLGPVDGHDLNELIRILRVAKDLKRPVLVHVLTQKGRGYAPAEDEPSKFHGIGKFDPESGMTDGGKGTTFSDTFGKTLLSLASQDDRVCAITAAMPAGTGLLDFKDKYPDRFFDVGIAEEHAISMSGGLAKQGMIPVVAIYSTFLQRAYDQIMQDIGLLGLHVVLAVDRAGLVGEDGETHHGVFDVGFLRQIPGMRILCPASCRELTDMLNWAVKECNGPVAVRYPRGGDGGYSGSRWCANEESPVCVHREGKDLTIITYGTMVDNAMTAAGELSRQGIEAAVLRLMAVSPLPMDAILNRIHGPVLILEEACSGSGIGFELSARIQESDTKRRVSRLDLGGNFVSHGKVSQLHSHHGLDGKSVADFVRKEHLYES